LYDHGRGRELHWAESLAAVDTSLETASAKMVPRRITIAEGEGSGFVTDLFELSVCAVGSEIMLPNNMEHFYCVYCMEGSVKLIFDEDSVSGQNGLTIEKGRCAVVPACFGRMPTKPRKNISKKVLTSGGGRAIIAFVAPRTR
jgi:hypothetical protein